MRYWDTWQHIYREERLVLLDTRYPSNKNLPSEKLETVQDRFNQWMLRLKAHEDSMLEAQSLLMSRSARKQEEKAMKESLKRARELEALIEAKKQPSTKKVSAERRAIIGSNRKGSKPQSEEGKSKKKESSSEVNKVSKSAMQRQINQLLVELREIKKQNTFTASVTNNNSGSSTSIRCQEREISPPSKRISELEKATREEELRLVLLAKKRQLVEEEEEFEQVKAAKKKLKLESIAHANQLLREGELERVKMKVQADQMQAESVL